MWLVESQGKAYQLKGLELGIDLSPWCGLVEKEKKVKEYCSL